MKELKKILEENKELFDKLYLKKLTKKEKEKLRKLDMMMKGQDWNIVREYCIQRVLNFLKEIGRMGRKRKTKDKEVK